MAGSVIQANGTVEFEDGLRTIARWGFFCCQKDVSCACEYRTDACSNDDFEDAVTSKPTSEWEIKAPKIASVSKSRKNYRGRVPHLLADNITENGQFLGMTSVSQVPQPTCCKSSWNLTMIIYRYVDLAQLFGHLSPLDLADLQWRGLRRWWECGLVDHRKDHPLASFRCPRK